MTLGYALIVVFVLYLIDKHNRWRQAAKIVAGLIVLAIVGIGGVYGWSRYREVQAENKRAAQQGAYEKRLQDCITRNTGVRRDIFDDVSAQEACAKDLDALPACWSKPYENGGLQVDLHNVFGPDGKRVPPDPKDICYPMIDAKAPDCKNGLVPGCIDRSSEPWKTYQKAAK